MTNTPQQDAALAALQGTFDADNTAQSVIAHDRDAALAAASQCMSDKTALQAAFDEYKRTHPDGPPPPPPPPPTGFHLGIDVAANDVRGLSKAALYTLVRQKVGRDLGGRLKFFGGANGTIADAVANQKSTGSTEPTPVMCFKDKATNKAAVIARADAVTGEEWWVFWQEFQRHILTGALTWTEINTMHHNIKTWLSGHPNASKIKIFADGSGYAERTNGGRMASANLDHTVIDVIGLDLYSDDSRPAPWTAPQLFDDLANWLVVAKSKNAKITAHVGELGVARWVTSAGAKVLLDPAIRLQVLKSYVAYLPTVGIGGANYWAVNNAGIGNSDWSIDLDADKPIQAWFKTAIQA